MIRTEELVQIKKTKSVEMAGSEFGVWIMMLESGQTMFVPISKIFQVKRGLESAVQKFYRRKHGK